jgi:hypothetical protein
MTINEDKAEIVLRRAAERSGEVESLDSDWVGRVEKLSELCGDGAGKTHLAMLCTAMLAKAVKGSTNLRAIKTKAKRAGPNAYSARTLCHNVVVPLSVEFGFSIGTTGREPLNNQPYFRIQKIGDSTPISKKSKEAFDFLKGLIEQLQQGSEADAERALTAFVHVRKQHMPLYSAGEALFEIGADELEVAIAGFVGADSDGGRRAQAVVAGLLDVVVGEDRVICERINDPSRNSPGDVCVKNAADDQLFDKAIEVRDKSVSNTDAQLFCLKCREMKVREVVIVAAGAEQENLADTELGEWAKSQGLSLTIFQGWKRLVHEALFWAGEAQPVAGGLAVEQIRRRLISLEAATESVDDWVRRANLGSGSVSKGDPEGIGG